MSSRSVRSPICRNSELGSLNESFGQSRFVARIVPLEASDNLSAADSEPVLWRPLSLLIVLAVLLVVMDRLVLGSLERGRLDGGRTSAHGTTS